MESVIGKNASLPVGMMERVLLVANVVFVRERQCDGDANGDKAMHCYWYGNATNGNN